MGFQSLTRMPLALAALALAAACAPAAPSPTAAPAKPAPTAAPAKAEAKAAEAKPAATQAPAAKPAEKPAEKAPTVRKEGPSFTFKFASQSPEADLSGVGIKHWANLVEQRTGGRIKFQYFWANSLLNATQMFTGVRDGLTDFGLPATSFVSGLIPDVATFEVPFAYPTDAAEALAFYRELEPSLREVFLAHNQYLLSAQPSTTPDPVSCRDKFLDSPQAWNGALVRTAGKWQGRTLELWGAKTVVIDLSEAYTAIQRGTADCLLLVYNLIDSFKLYEVAKYITRIDHSINLQTMTVNKAVWDKIPPEDQQIMLQAAHETQDFLVKQRDNYVTQAIEKFKSQGAKVCTPSQQELQRLRGTTERVLEEIAREQTPKGKQMQEIAKKYRDRVKVIGPTEGDMTPCPGGR